MSGLLKKNITWLTEFHQKTAILETVCNNITYKDGKEDLWVSAAGSASPGKMTAYSLKGFPSYLKPSFRDNKKYTIKRYPSVKGFAIDMASNSDLEDYMRAQFNKKVRAHQMRALRRFEHCFELRQERYFGHIDEEVCEHLLKELRTMIVRRFQQRRQESDTLKSWEKIANTTYNLVLEKKASIFVIYHGNKAVSISVSYHYDKLFFYYVTSYDTDYAKFSLGNIMIIKQLEWSYENGYRYFDMGWGDLDYKRRWCNLVYNNTHFFIFPRNSPQAWMWSSLKGNKTRLMAYLLNRGYNKYYGRLKAKLLPRSKNKSDLVRSVPGPIVKGESREFDSYSPIMPSEHPGLNYYINTFLYLSQEEYSAVKVYRVENNRFLIRAGLHSQEVTFTDNADKMTD